MSTNHIRIILFAFLLCFLGGAQSAELETSVTVRASIEKSQADIRIKNIGSEIVNDLSIDVYFKDQQKLTDRFETLAPGDDMTAKEVDIANELLPGNYHFPIFLSYQLNSGEKKHSLAINDLIIRPSTNAGLNLTTSSTILSSDAHADVPLTIENPDLFRKTITIQVYSPGLIHIPDPISVTLDAQSSIDVEIPIHAKERVLETKAELIYVLSFTHNQAHYSTTSKSAITVTPKQSLLTRLFSQQSTIIVVIICLALIIIVVSIRRR